MKEVMEILTTYYEEALKRWWAAQEGNDKSYWFGVFMAYGHALQVLRRATPEKSEHLSGPNGCHPECPACEEEKR